MTALLLIVLALPTLLILPGWFWARRKRPQPAGLLALPAFGIGIWFSLVLVRIGAQSLSNLIETIYVAAAAVAIAHVKFLLLDRWPASRKYGTLVSFALVALVAIGLRLFMPLLPE